jgi:hypothetical protein
LPLNFVQDDKSMLAAAQALVEHAAVMNGNGRLADTIAVAVQGLAGPLRMQGVEPSVMLTGLAAGLGAVMSLAYADDQDGEIAMSLVREAIRRSFKQCAVVVAEKRGRDA